MSAQPILSLDGVSSGYGAAMVVRGVSLELKPGEILAVLGKNGMGKSTLLKTIMGFVRAVEGRVSLQGQDVTRRAPHLMARSRVAYTPQEFTIFQDLTVEENLKCGAFTRPRSEIAGSMDKVYAYFPRLKERSKQLAGYMSGGEQQMCAIGRAIMARPELLLLDEPSLGLAPLLVEEIFEIIKRFNQDEGVTILLVEQNARAALSVAEQAYIMENGRVVMDGTARELLNNPDVQEFYLGMGHTGDKKSYRDVKHYRRRKRWLG